MTAVCSESGTDGRFHILSETFKDYYLGSCLPKLLKGNDGTCTKKSIKYIESHR